MRTFNPSCAASVVKCFTPTAAGRAAAIAVSGSGEAESDSREESANPGIVADTGLGENEFANDTHHRSSLKSRNSAVYGEPVSEITEQAIFDSHIPSGVTSTCRCNLLAHHARSGQNR